MYHMNNCSITTTNERRLRLWHNLFGATELPVMSPRPRFQYRKHRPERIYAYDLDASRLTEWQRSRFAAYIARKMRVNYATALHLVDAWPIEASGCRVVESSKEETAVPSWETAVFAFMGIDVRARTSQYYHG